MHACYQQDEENAKAISLFRDVVKLSNDIEDESKRLENLVRGIFAGNIFDLGSAKVGDQSQFLKLSYHLCTSAL